MSLVYSLHIPSTHLGALATFSNIRVFTAAAQPFKGARWAEDLAAKALGDSKWVPFESYETDSKSPAEAPDRGGPRGPLDYCETDPNGAFQKGWMG